MSGIEGLDAVLQRLDAYGEAVDRRMDEAVETAARQMQADLVSLAPVYSGRLREALSSADAVSLGIADARRFARVGFLTEAQKRAAFHGFFVEFGTKGWRSGENRAAGKDSRGNARVRRVRRYIPARPAHPFFRPALAMLRQNIIRLRAEAHAAALRDMAGASVAGALERAL